MIVKQEIIICEKLSPSSNKLLSDIKYKSGKQKSPIASHDPREKYLVSLQLLKLFIGLGLEMTKIIEYLDGSKKQL